MVYCGAAGDGLQHRRFHFKEIALHQEAADVRDHLRTYAEGLAHVFVDDQVNITLTVALLGVSQAVVLIWQRTQRLGQQTHVGHFHVQITLAGTSQGAYGGDDVAHVPAFYGGQDFFRQGLAVDVDLDAPRHVLNNHERATVEHDATGNLDWNGSLDQLFLGLLGVLFLQVGAVVVTAKIVGEGVALRTDGSKLFFAQGNQLVFFLLLVFVGKGLRVELLVAHGRSSVL